MIFKRPSTIDELEIELSRFRKSPDMALKIFGMEQIMIQQLRTLLRIEELLKPDDTPYAFDIYLVVNGRRIDDMAQEISASSQVDVVCEVLNKKGKPARVDGSLQFNITKGAELLDGGKVDASGLKISYVPVGDEGDVEGEVVGDADLSPDGVKPIKGTFAFKLTPMEASAIKIALVEVKMEEPAPVPQPEPVPEPQPEPVPQPEPAPVPEENQ